jgi:copper(I)-binding protein
VIRSSRKTVANGLLIAALALLIPAAAGCEAGLDAPTLQFHPASAGAHAEVNGISINNVFVLGAPGGHPVPTGQSASLFLSLYNGGTGNDTLVSVSSPDAASSVQVTGGTVSLPVNSLVNLMGPQPSVVLSGLTQPLASGTAIPVTLDFQHAGSVTLDVPVQPQQYYYSTFSPPPAAPAGSPTPTPTGTATP